MGGFAFGLQRFEIGGVLFYGTLEAVGVEGDGSQAFGGVEVCIGQDGRGIGRAGLLLGDAGVETFSIATARLRRQRSSAMSSATDCSSMPTGASAWIISRQKCS